MTLLLSWLVFVLHDLRLSLNIVGFGLRLVSSDLRRDLDLLDLLGSDFLVGRFDWQLCVFVSISIWSKSTRLRPRREWTCCRTSSSITTLSASKNCHLMCFKSYILFWKVTELPVSSLFCSFFQDGLKTADKLKQYIEKLAADLFNVRRSFVLFLLIGCSGEATGVTSAVPTDQTESGWGEEAADGSQRPHQELLTAGPEGGKTPARLGAGLTLGGGGA